MKVEPSYRLHEQFLVDTLHVAFAYDSVPTSHPMSMPKETYHIFDPIEYDKGITTINETSDRRQRQIEY